MNKQKKIGLAVLVVILLYAAISVFFQYHYFIGTKVNGYSCGFRSVSKTKELIKEDIKAYKITIKERNKKKESISFSQVNLAFKDDGKLEGIKAQQKGYAEADPTADVGGADACRKIAILSSLAYGKFLNYEDIYTEGITKITPADMEYAKELGMTIKLLATSRRIGDSFYAMVAPFLVGQSSPLYSVNDVFNAVFVHGNVLGDAMFYGSGAGKLPTASAVVADVVDEAKHLHRNIMTNWSSYALKLMDMDEVEGRFFVRVSDTTMDEVEKAFGDVQTIEPDDLPDEFGFITPVMKQAEYYEKISKLTGKVLAMIRVKD